MKAWLIKNKGYIFHAAAVGIIFLSPSVQHALTAYPAVSALGGAAWGFLLHWAQGK